MRIYLASRYSRRTELCRYREQVQSAGHTVTSRWLNGEHQIDITGVPIGEDGETLVEGTADQSEQAAKLRQRFAMDDFADVISADLLIAFTELPRSGHSRGGRHVELGIALGRMQKVWVIGYRENLFCWLNDVRFFEEWESALSALKQ